MGHEGKHVNDLTKEETERLMNFDADEEYEDIPAEVSGWYIFGYSMQFCICIQQIWQYS